MLSNVATRDALSLLATPDDDMQVRAIVQMDTDELRSTVLQLLGLVHLRHTVGTEIDDTRVWARWLLNQDTEV